MNILIILCILDCQPCAGLRQLLHQPDPLCLLLAALQEGLLRPVYQETGDTRSEVRLTKLHCLLRVWL